MAMFWLALYIFVNLTSIVWLGSIAVNKVAGVDQDVALIALGAFALLYQLRGGLKAVAPDRHRPGHSAGARRPRSSVLICRSNQIGGGTGVDRRLRRLPRARAGPAST